MKSAWLWDRLAKNYDTPGVSLGENDIRIIEKTKKYLSPGDSVLDYGCATGSIAMEIAKTVKAVHGIDISSKMIDLANRKAGDFQMKNVVFTLSTIFDEGLKPESFSVITAFSLLHLLENPLQVITRINTLLKPGGFFISATPCPREKLMPGILIVLPLFLASRVGILPHVNFFNAAGFEKLLNNAAFQVVEKDNLSAGIIVDCFIAARKK